MIRYSAYSHQGGRAINEDTVMAVSPDPEHLCLVVADGLGGHGGGQEASSLAARTICDSWHGQPLQELLTKAHQAVQSIQIGQAEMKSTVVALAVSGDEAACIHAGDSRLYHFADGQLVFQTKDHSASQVAVMLGDITPAEIRFHVDRNRILRALGQEGSLRGDETRFPLSSGKHAFLLCTDGFWEYVLEAEMEEDLNLAQSPEDWLSRMRSRLNARIPEDCDNNTAAVVWIEQ